MKLSILEIKEHGEEDWDEFDEWMEVDEEEKIASQDKNEDDYEEKVDGEAVSGDFCSFAAATGFILV